MSETPMDPQFERLAAAYADAEVWAQSDHDTTDEDDAAHLAVATTFAALWRHVCGLVEAAYRAGYDDGSDPAWCEKQLRRAGVKAEAHEAAATDYFWQEYRATLSGAAATETEARDE